jgi:hypothetical protein
MGEGKDHIRRKREHSCVFAAVDHGIKIGMSAAIAFIGGDLCAETTFESIHSKKSELNIQSLQSVSADVKIIELTWTLRTLGVKTCILMKQLEFSLL